MVGFLNFYPIAIVALTFCSYVFPTGAVEEKIGQNQVNKNQALFAMGCFWCGEAVFMDVETHQPLKGISLLRVGYGGGTIQNPTYENHPGHKEVVSIEFNPDVIAYEKLLEIFWLNVDPFDEGGQFCDRGFSYTSAIFFADALQKEKALRSKEKIEKRFNKPVLTEILPLTTFYDAEEMHQRYKKKNPLRYKYYHWRCGRQQRLQALWK